MGTRDSAPDGCAPRALLTIQKYIDSIVPYVVPGKIVEVGSAAWEYIRGRRDGRNARRAIDKSHLIDCIRKVKVTRLFVVLDAANRDAITMHFWFGLICDMTAVPQQRRESVFVYVESSCDGACVSCVKPVTPPVFCWVRHVCVEAGQCEAV